MLEQNAKRWDQMLQERRRKEIEYMEIREKRVEDFEQQLQYQRIQDAEEYNQVKIKLETDVQVSWKSGHLFTILCRTSRALWKSM